MVYWLVIALNFSLWFVLHLCLVNDDDDNDDDNSSHFRMHSGHGRVNVTSRPKSPRCVRVKKFRLNENMLRAYARQTDRHR